MIITIDGPVATGKSTIAKKLAQAINFMYVDTGAMYRCLTYGLTKNHIPLNDIKAVTEFLSHFNFTMKIGHEEPHYYVNGEDVTLAIRDRSISSRVSQVSALAVVREQLVVLQKKLAIGKNAVFEGRDMGTVVFPHAELKIFLTGNAEVRAERRFKELCVKFPHEIATLSLDKVIQELNERDHYDTTREHSPLKQAKDAYVIDTSYLTIDAIIDAIIVKKNTIKEV